MHSLCGYCYNDLGNLYAKLGIWGKAEENYKLSQNIVRKVFGEDHPSMAKNRYNIGRALLKQGNINNGLAEIVAAYLTSRKFYGDDKVKTLKIKAQIFGALQTNNPSSYEQVCEILRNLLKDYQDVLDQFKVPEKKAPPPPKPIPPPIQIPEPAEEEEEFYFFEPSPKVEKFRPHAVDFIPTEEKEPPKQLSLYEQYLQSINYTQNPSEKVESSDEECAAKEEAPESSDSDCAAFDLFA